MGFLIAQIIAPPTYRHLGGGWAKSREEWGVQCTSYSAQALRAQLSINVLIALRGHHLDGAWPGADAGFSAVHRVDDVDALQGPKSRRSEGGAEIARDSRIRTRAPTAAGPLSPADPTHRRRGG